MNESAEWMPAAVVRPLPGRSLEFLKRSISDASRGTFLPGVYIDRHSGERIEAKDVLKWKYLQRSGGEISRRIPIGRRV